MHELRLSGALITCSVAANDAPVQNKKGAKMNALLYVEIPFSRCSGSHLEMQFSTSCEWYGLRRSAKRTLTDEA